MIVHSEVTLGMAVSAPLIAGWEQLEAACKIGANGSAAWQVLQLPTGTGKTQALAVLCASQNVDRLPGILVVTKCRAEADQLATTINKLSNSRIALAVHQKSPAPTSQVHASPVLIVTHSAYRHALQEIASGSAHQVQWDRIRHYQQAERAHGLMNSRRGSVQSAGALVGKPTGTLRHWKKCYAPLLVMTPVGFKGYLRGAKSIWRRTPHDEPRTFLNFLLM